eukprot:TRINITY_DN7635_c0_g1_i2.p1 TRINITY_DN7635_c0_g1~~TRINITY_DN7635_c0_g1_i2.p1  ORF type:complete len:381 (+),score=70.36 TRINITY_DN7635_c0_g1_i2:84-1145(+)
MAIFLSTTTAAAASAVISAAAGIASATLAMSRELKASSKISSTTTKPFRVHCRMHASKRSIDGYASISGDLLMVGSTSDSFEDILSVQGTEARLSGRDVEVIKAGEKYLTLTFDDVEQASVSLFELRAAAQLVQRSAFSVPTKRASKQKPWEYNRGDPLPSQFDDKQVLRAKVLELEQDFNRKVGERVQRQVSESIELRSKLAKSTADAEAKGRRVDELRRSMEIAESRSKEAEDELAKLKDLCVSQELEIQALKERLHELQELGIRTSSKSSCGSISEDLPVSRKPRRLRSANIEATVNMFESLSADRSQYVTKSHDFGMFRTPRNIRILSTPMPIWTQSRAESASRLRVMA